MRRTLPETLLFLLWKPVNEMDILVAFLGSLFTVATLAAIADWFFNDDESE